MIDLDRQENQGTFLYSNYTLLFMRLRAVCSTFTNIKIKNQVIFYALDL